MKGQKLAGLTTINFQNNITDVGWMNEVLAYRLYRDAGALAPRTTYAQVYLTVEGQPAKRYLGLYSVSENVDDNFAEDRFGTRKGAIFKPSTQELFTDWDWERQCRFIASVGYTGIEVAPFTLAPRIGQVSVKRRHLMRRQAAEHGLSILGLHWLLAKMA